MRQDTQTQKTVKTALLHQPINIPGVTSDKTLNKTKIPGIEMVWDEQGLWISVKGHTGIIPAPNVAFAIFE